MNQYLQASRLVKIRTIAIATSLGLATSLLLSIIFSQPSHALILDKLLPQTTQALTGVVNQVLTPPQLPSPPRNPFVANPQPAPQSAPPVTVQPTQAPSATASVPAATQQPPASAAIQQSSASVQLISMNLQPIEFLPASYADKRNTSKPAAFYASASSPKSSFLLLEPTDQGWQLLGMMWYGWLAFAAGLIGSVIFWKRKGEQLSYQILSWRNITYAD